MPAITARISSAFNQKDEGKIDRSNMDVRTDRVYVSVPSKKIVEGATIDVSPGEFVGLIGPNGSGKSTLLKSIYRVMKKDSGEIDLGGESIDSMSYRDSAMRMAVVTQHNYFNFEFKVEDVVFMGRTPHKGPMEMDSSEDRRIVEEALDRVNMLEMKDRAFATLSGGEQQRIMLARALAQDTPILILDEPTNHLDIKYQLEVLDIVKELGCTTLCALHDLNLAAQYCDRLYVLKDGHIISSGRPEDVITPQMIKEVYGVDAIVEKHPVTGLLNIVYIPGHRRPGSEGKHASE